MHPSRASHSEKEQTTGNDNGEFGFAPFIASIDYCTGETLSALLRHGGATANRRRRPYLQQGQ